MGDFKEHCLRLYLDKTLYKAFVRLQADKGLGRSYAGLLSLVEGLFHLGYLKKEDYEKHFERYSEELAEEPKPATRKESEDGQELEKMRETFESVLDQWDLHPSIEWRQKWIRQAAKWTHKLTIAKQVSEKLQEEAPEHV
jgi:Zn-dependent protease with chaperone function